MTDHWSVTVERNGETVVCIESNSLSGRRISDADEHAIAVSAQALLAFIGHPAVPGAGDYHEGSDDA